MLPKRKIRFYCSRCLLLKTRERFVEGRLETTSTSSREVTSMESSRGTDANQLVSMQGKVIATKLRRFSKLRQPTCFPLFNVTFVKRQPRHALENRRSSVICEIKIRRNEMLLRTKVAFSTTPVSIFAEGANRTNENSYRVWLNEDCIVNHLHSELFFNFVQYFEIYFEGQFLDWHLF